MWLFTKYGFFASANARQGKGESWQPVDKDRIAIRARDKQHLANLATRFPVLANVPVHDDTAADYRYRIFVPKTQWAEIVSELADEMDYDRFKPSVIPFEGDKDYKHTLLDVWSLMYATQK